MNPNDEQELKSAISRELKALPELAAPASLASRIMAAVELRFNVPWYRRSWETWPVALRLASLATLLALFCGLCFAGWELSRMEIFTQAMHRVELWFSGFDTIRNMLGILISSVVLVVKKMGTPFIVACLVAAGLGYAICVSLGTVYFKLAFPKR